MKLPSLLLPGLAVGAAVVLTAPQRSEAFNLLPGRNLDVTEMDFRVFDNFLDPQANDNLTEHPNFPGQTGAVAAIWKGAYEWASEPRGGTGEGDPHQAVLGSGNSNFDPMFTGLASSDGDPGSGFNVISSLDQNGGGTLAFMQPGTGDSWQIRFYDSFNWSDGPGTSIGSNFDIQSVAAHEYGHALGLDHSFSGGLPTMRSGIGSGQVFGRSIANDDIAGVQAIYGTINNNNKPRILSVQNLGGVVEIEVENLNPDGNEVWFTRQVPTGAAGSGQAVKVVDVSTTSGGTKVVAVIPDAAGVGEVLVKRLGSGQASTSAPWPFDPDAVTPTLPAIASLSQSQFAPLTTAGATESFSIFGNDLLATTAIRIDGALLDNGTTFSGSYTIVDDGQIDVVMPLASSGIVTLELEGPGGVQTDSTSIEIVPAATPVLASQEPDIVSSVGVNFAVTAQQNDIVFLLVSGLGGPTVIPGVIDLEIGSGNPNALFKIKTWTIGAKLWRKQGYGPFTGLPAGATVYFEGWVLEAANAYEAPWNSTNAVPLVISS